MSFTFVPRLPTLSEARASLASRGEERVPTPVEPRAVLFDRNDVVRFARISRDVNPLHVDPAYARRTPFGQCLAYGILGVIALLRETLGEEPRELRKLAVRFLKPLLLDTPYAIHVERQEEERLVASLGSSENPRLTLEVAFANAERPWPTPSRVEPSSQRSDPGDLDPDDPTCVGRRLSGLYTPALEPLCGERPFLPLGQIAALLWSSWFVGMKAPGRQALFRSLSLEFAGASEGDGSLSYDARVDAYQRETSLFTFSAELGDPTGPIGRAAITAARRPPPVEPAFAELEARLGKSAALAGKRALVTGSSRGLGALIAYGCALQGADVIVHAREGSAEAEGVARAIRSIGRAATIARGCVRRRETWEHLRATAESLGRLDILILNAAPAPLARPFAETENDDAEDFVAEGVRSGALALRLLAPLVAMTGGTVVNISSDVVRRAPRELARETAVRAAVEALVLALASEYRSVKFVTARPPRLHTDRTNDIIAAFRGRPPEGVAAAIVRSLLEPRGGANHVLLESFDP
jgi:NAD(P)-dependent dehydrogenase (short-subunit alcohol dehydrogenase family)/acyl dehydratase